MLEAASGGASVKEPWGSCVAACSVLALLSGWSCLGPRARASNRCDMIACICFVLIALATTLVECEISCTKDGLFPEYESDCTRYYRCSGGAARGRYACPSGRGFDALSGACVPQHRLSCVQHACPPKDTAAYAAPGAACRRYYRCANGTATDHVCPAGAWFDLPRQSCTYGAGTCYEPLCAGLVDGDHPDASQDCLRMVTCQGAHVRSVTSCGGRCLPASMCPPARGTAVPIPTGDANFCSDTACSSLCESVAEGPHADRTTGCREYFMCEAGRVTRRGVCEPGHLFDQGACRPARLVSCGVPARSPCFGRTDGLHRDWRDCSSWFECQRERVASRGSCDAGLVFDGARCVSRHRCHCEPPRRSADCDRRPSGNYQDLESNCTRYFHCEGSLKTLLSCPPGQVFDGRKCVTEESFLCPSREADSCHGRRDGRYASRGGCRGFYACSAGQKALYACPPGMAFYGGKCVAANEKNCPKDSSCKMLSDGYHPDTSFDCKKYLYCEGGDRLATFSCLGGMVFDGRACVMPSQYHCKPSLEPTRNRLQQPCTNDGFFPKLGTKCQQYYFCIQGRKTEQTCPADQLFNGQVCVPDSLYTCPG